MPKLACQAVMFYSQGDELSFFKWIDSINCIKKFEGVGDTMHLTVKKHKISDRCLRELIALFYRYKIDMSQLEVFLNDKNKEWFYDRKKMFWHKKVFKNKR